MYVFYFNSQQNSTTHTTLPFIKTKIEMEENEQPNTSPNTEEAVSDSSTTDAVKIFSWVKKKRTHTTKTELPPDTHYAPLPNAEHYKMNHRRRGVAIIFNHVNFSIPDIKTRQGSDKDRNDLHGVFTELGFDVEVYNDLDAFDIYSVLLRVSRMDHSDADCLVIVVMSHGDNGKIYAKDRLYPTKQLWSCFTAKSCPTLAGKPKLFFIQACRGNISQEKAILRYDTVDTSTDPNEAFYSIPILADILIMYSTTEGCVSWRDPEKGGYFIQSLVKNLKRHHKSRDLLSILTFVNREVAVDFEVINPQNARVNGAKQICSIVSMLTRLVYFTNQKTLLDV